jgi:oligopeptide/dipeptide ABC transporter ATP-binding protein
VSSGLFINDLTLEFAHGDGRAAAVNRCNLTIHPKEIVGLVGESGSGKSLTALACLGLTPPNCRVSGSLRVDGDQIIGTSEAKLAALRGRKIAMIFQNPMTALNPYFTIGSQMDGVIRQHFPLKRSEARSEAVAALQQAGLAESALSRYPHQMSGGQLQRAMIAMAIACKPEFLIADEPTTALDVTVQARILNLLRTLADQGMGILLITHDLGVVAQVADRAAVMYSGSIVESGDLKQVFSAAAHPYTVGLMQSSPVMGMGRRKLLAIPGVVPDFRNRLAGCAFRDRCTQAQEACSAGATPRTSLAAGHEVHCHFPIGQALGAELT